MRPIQEEHESRCCEADTFVSGVVDTYGGCAHELQTSTAMMEKVMHLPCN